MVLVVSKKTETANRLAAGLKSHIHQGFTCLLIQICYYIYIELRQTTQKDKAMQVNSENLDIFADADADKAKFFATLDVVTPELAEVLIAHFGGWKTFKDQAHLVYGNGILGIKSFTDIDSVVKIYQDNQKIVISYLMDLAVSLEYDNILDMLADSKGVREKYQYSEIALALFDRESPNHKDISPHAIWLAAQMFCFEYESFLFPIKQRLA